ncbi:membrane protein insertase YidC [Lederbergia sp. NSJ-179]|uniref:membrane protein insertase YidC n=1 Tax=Lederbergia sp. NSJ-179 TaxID=2931402 RepID=UPI001FD48A94|nr:membrane protein insertase YidC [Lederbergia sp. NSJ-179]MCJ7841050.1 membrane protein insertase YidC [Lederbergia sp. NSJ-179]
MKKNILLLSLLVITSFMLGGCSGVENKTGFFYNTFVRPLSWGIHEIGSTLWGEYGLAIIIITLIIRLVLLPFMLNTYKKQQEMKVKMDKIKPEMDDIQKRLKATKNPEEQKKIQQEMMLLYQKHNVNPLGVGCLPVIIQMPILMGLYWAIRSSADIASHSFLWFDLGNPDWIMMLIAGLVYFIQAEVSLVTVPEAQKKQMKMFSYLSPIMIMFISFSAPAALPLYWTVSGIFMIFQTWLGRKFYMQHPEKVEEKGDSKSPSK